MSLPTRLKRLSPFVGLGLIIPVLWSLVVIGLPDDRLATVDDAVIIEGLPGAETRRSSEGDPVLNVTIREVVADPAGTDLAPGDRIQVLVPTGGTGAGTVLSADRALDLALEPTQERDPETGTVTWQGWRSTDARAGTLWTLQAEALQGAMLAAVSSVGGAILTGYALGLPQEVRRPILEVDGPAAVGGLFLGVVVGGVMAAMGSGTNLLLPRSADGIPLPGALGAALIAMAGVGAAWKRRLVLPNGGRTATVGGLALLISVPSALILGWDGRLDAGLLLLDQLPFAAAVGAIAVLGVVGARWLRLRWARLLAGLLLLAPTAYVLVTSPVLLAVALPVGVIGLAGARDLFGPALVAPSG